MIIEGRTINTIAEMLEFCQAAVAASHADPSAIRLHVPQDMRVAEITRADGSKVVIRRLNEHHPRPPFLAHSRSYSGLRRRRWSLRDGRPSCALGLAAMLKKSLRANYQRKLAHVVVLADGTKLVTLRDAANVLLDAANARSGGLDNAIRLLSTGRRDANACRRYYRDRRDRARAAGPALAVTRTRSSALPPARRRTYPPGMKWDDLKPLPDHVVAPLLRALMCIPRSADTRLLLVKRTDGRPAGYDRENDYDVVFRGRKVGRIWKYDYTGKVSGEMARWLWHWDWHDVEGRKDAEGHCGSLEVAIPRAWDAPGGNVISTRR